MINNEIPKFSFQLKKKNNNKIFPTNNKVKYHKYQQLYPLIENIQHNHNKLVIFTNNYAFYYMGTNKKLIFSFL